MNSKQALVVLGTAALCGLAFAQTPKTRTPAERLDALEAQVQALEKQLAALKQPAGDEAGVSKKEAAETRELASQLAKWAQVQSLGAAELAKVLDDAEQKGFTFGINPESRIALLAGWREFSAGLQKDVPLPLPSTAVPPADAKAGTAKKP